MSYMYAAPVPFDPFDGPTVPYVPPSKPPTEAAKPTSDMEKEALAMAECARVLAVLSSDSRRKALEWLRCRFNEAEYVAAWEVGKGIVCDDSRHMSYVRFHRDEKGKVCGTECAFCGKVETDE